MVRKVRLPLWRRPTGDFVEIDADATQGAKVGKDFKWPDGTVVKEAEIRNPVGDDKDTIEDFSPTIWQLIRNIPTIVRALVSLATDGLVTKTGAGLLATRAITGTAGDITVADGDGVAADPTVGLADVTQGSGGTLYAITLDAKGRVVENRPTVASDFPSQTITEIYGGNASSF